MKTAGAAGAAATDAVPQPIASPELEEPIRILSDLHLGHPGCRVLEAAQLGPLIEGAKTVIFNGDTSEERSVKFVEKGRQQFAALKALCAEVGATPVFITGNHDPISPPHHALDLFDGRVFVTHGDVLFPDVSPWSKFHAFAVEAMVRIHAEYSAEELGQLEVLLEANKRVSAEMKVRQPKVAPGFWGRVKTLFYEAWPPKRPLKIIHTWLTVHKLAHAFKEKHRPEAKLMVIGHTHRPYVSKRNGATIVNTGAHLAISGASIIELEEGKWTVHKIALRNDEYVRGSARARGEY